MSRFYYSIVLLLICISCDNSDQTQFILKDASLTNITFKNELNYTERLNAYTYRNFYNGAGVAVGDINNDGLVDIYVSGNLVDNKLYLNQGDFKFQDITEQAGVSCSGVWSTGVTMADVNGDGWLDIYVCKSGAASDKKSRSNQLFINNKDLTFTDQSEEYGIDDNGLATHAIFFDVDNDYDLDMYLLNNSGRSIGLYDLRDGQREIRDSLGSNKLYLNTGNGFKDISEKAGVYGSAIGYGLGVTASDLDKDGYQDLFVSNDFFERDYLYLNNGDHTFSEKLNELVTESSLGSMGADIADINNDGYTDIFVTEMLPQNLEREKTKAVFEDWNKFENNLKNGYHRQFSRNVLQLNNGLLGDSLLRFSEVGRYAGIEATDWSWGALIFDVDNDGLQDVFVANGIGKDITDQDYINYYANNSIALSKSKSDSLLITNLMDRIPSKPLENFLFINNGDLTFSNEANKLGLDQFTFSSGAAYGDLDNDGDLDLVVNNINAPLGVYENSLQKDEHQWLQIKFKGKGMNTSALGTKVEVYSKDFYSYKEQNPVKGYMSSMDPVLHFGLGSSKSVDSLVIHWPDGGRSALYDVKSNQRIELVEEDIKKESSGNFRRANLIFERDSSFLQYENRENQFSDFNRDALLHQMYSNEGPVTTLGDFNGDGHEDIFIGASKGERSALYFYMEDSFKLSDQRAFDDTPKYEDSDVLATDIDNDGDLDLIVGSGGNEFGYGSVNLKNRVYINDGKGEFTLGEQDDFSSMRESTGFIVNVDLDGDGDQDLLEGTRLIPFAYGVPGNIRSFYNNGRGKFTQVKLEEFEQVGLMTDAEVVDYDNDGDEDIVVVGQWMPVTVYTNESNTFTKSVIPNSSGMWNTLTSGFVDNDNQIDIVIGNAGLNSRYNVNSDETLVAYVNDFDGNGAIETIICQESNGKEYPLVLLPELMKQIPLVKKKYPTFDSYKNQTIQDIFSNEVLSKAHKSRIDTHESRIYSFNKNDQWSSKALPNEINYSAVHALKLADINSDNRLDILFGGNQYKGKPQFGIYGAFIGGYIANLDTTFRFVSPEESGLAVYGEVRAIEVVGKSDKRIIYIRNSDEVEVFKSTQ